MLPRAARVRASLRRRSIDGPPIGVALIGPDDAARLVSVDVGGALWVLSWGSRRDLVKVALSRGFRVYASLGQLVEALHAGLAVGLVLEALRGVALFPFD